MYEPWKGEGATEEGAELTGQTQTPPCRGETSVPNAFWVRGGPADTTGSFWETRGSLNSEVFNLMTPASSVLYVVECSALPGHILCPQGHPE